MTDRSDTELLRAWADGDREAGAELFDRWFPAISGFFRTKVAGGAGLDVQDDLVQSTFTACIESSATFRAEGTFRSWLFGIAYNVLRRHWERSRRDARIDFGTVSLHDLAPGAPSVLDLDARRARLLHAMRRLPLQLQTALELYYWESMSAAEIARTLELPEGTVRTRLRRARGLLAARLAEDGAPADLLPPSPDPD
jgi:RNA polymerase sigma factor (sigma-70 family)